MAYAQETTVIAPPTPVSDPVAETAPPADVAPTPPAETRKDADPLVELRDQFKVLSTQKIDSPVVVVPTPESLNTEPDTSVEDLKKEVVELKKEVARLQETVDVALAYLVGELGDQNRRLKEGLSSTTADEASADVPSDAPSATEPVPVAAVDYGELGYRIVKSWGRTPEEAAAMTPVKSSLRGMICAVRPNASDDELKAIGKKIRTEFAAYDNLNIDVFDDEVAAEVYAERNIQSSDHFVMNITRHKQSGRDATIIIRENGTREVSVD